MARKSRVQKIFGVPGSGKTTYLLDTLERVIEAGTPPERIAYLTFTRHARLEAKGRVIQRFGFTEEQLIYFRTIHSICFQQLGLSRDLIVNGRVLREFSAKYGFPMTLYGGTKSFEEDNLFAEGMGTKAGDKFLAFDHWRRHKMLDFETAYKRWPESLIYFEVEQFTRVYKQWREEEGLTDFTDFLEEAKFPLDVDIVFVDEAQDLSDLQHKVVDMFAANAREIYYAGDDDQCIFQWAGASAEIFIDMPGKVKVLEKSWRMPQTIGALSQRIVKQIGHRQPKNFAPRMDPGLVTYYDSIDTINFTKDETWKILVRNNYLKKSIMDTLTMEGVPYSNNGVFAVDSQTLHAMFAWEKVRKGGSISFAEAADIYNHITTRIGVEFGAKKKLDDLRKNKDEQVTFEGLQKSCGLLLSRDVPWYEALSRIDDKESAYLRSVGREYGSKLFADVLDREKNLKKDIPGVVDIYSIHAAKGSEADNVVLLGEMAGRCLDQLATDPDPEIRVWYTGVSRAKHQLMIVGGNELLNL